MSTKPRFSCGVGRGLGPYYWLDRFLVVLREMQEREKALRLQKERPQKELEEKKRKVGVLGKWAPCGFCAELRAESTGKPGLYTLQAALPCHMG